MMLTGLADVLRGAGLDVVEEPGWRTRGHGPMLDVLGVTCHHTANGGAAGDAPSLAVVRDGRPGLDGPLAHTLVARSGRWHVIAAGLCYHAGESLLPAYTNAYRIGIEAEAAGDGRASDWPDAQMGSYALGCWALAHHYDVPVSQVLGHKETCAPVGRKIDPSFGMDHFRTMTREAAVLTGDDKTWIRGQLAKLAAAVWDNDSIPAPKREPDPTTNPQWRPESYLKVQLDTLDQLRDILQELAARPPVVPTPIDVQALADALAPHLEPVQDPAEIAQAVLDGLATRLALA